MIDLLSNVSSTGRARNVQRGHGMSLTGSRVIQRYSGGYCGM